MKPQHFAAVAGLLVLTALLLIISGRPQSGAANPAAQFSANRISVAGEGEVRVRPGLARLTFGILTHGASALEAEALNSAAVTKVKAALAAAGADESAYESSVTLTATTHTDAAGLTRIAGYEARSRLTALLHSPGRAQAAVEAALIAGATSHEEVTYSLESPEAPRQAAVAAALENARQRAEALASASAEKLGDMVALEVEQDPTASASAQSLVFRARVKATYEY